MLVFGKEINEKRLKKAIATLMNMKLFRVKLGILSHKSAPC